MLIASTPPKEGDRISIWEVLVMLTFYNAKHGVKALFIYRLESDEDDESLTGYGCERDDCSARRFVNMGTIDTCTHGELSYLQFNVPCTTSVTVTY